MKAQFPTKILFLFVLLALIFSAAGVAPAKAAGTYTHTWFVERAIQRLVAEGGYPELVTILNAYPGIVNYGAMFPDITYGYIDHTWGDAVHDGSGNNGNYTKYLQFLTDQGYDQTNISLQTGYYRQFLSNSSYNAVVPTYRAALLDQIIERFKHNPRTADDEKMIAFLFGFIAHQEADVSWHWTDPKWLGLESRAYNLGMNNCGFSAPLESANHPEMCLDIILRNTDNPDHAFDTNYLNSIRGTVLAAADASGIARPGCYGRAFEYDPIICRFPTSDPFVDGQSQISTLWAAQTTRTDLVNNDWYNFVRTYQPGGIEYGSAFVAGAWMHTWDLLTQTVLYVKPAASGTHTCESWQNACTLSFALSHSLPGQEIWVAAGVYKPTTGTDRTVAFQLSNGVAVYGGFAGTETKANQHDPMAHPSILSGDIDNNDTNTDGNNIAESYTHIQGNNAYHVVTGANGATLDGFTITGGKANGANPNEPYQNGGGIAYYTAGTAVFQNLVIQGNFAGNPGGGMISIGNAPHIASVTFIGNSANEGGGLANWYSSSRLYNVTFTGNSATNGGAIYNGHSEPWVKNGTIAGNTATLSAGGVYNIESNNVKVWNTILWNNTNGQMAAYNSTGGILYNSIAQGGCPEGISCPDVLMTEDPKLGALGDYGGLTPTLPLLQGSPAINAGDDVNAVFNDQRWVVRPQGIKSDIGAYEYEFSTVYYVKPQASGEGSCQSWANACALQTALANFIGGEIWVAAGVYKPTAGTDRAISFQLKPGALVYGGFAGTETQRSQRNPAAYPTILSGDIDNNDTNTDGNNIAENFMDLVGNNSHHVVKGATGIILDGFTITAGIGADINNPAQDGAGIYNQGIRNALFSNLHICGNSAAGIGGGMANGTSTPEIVNVTFSGNVAGSGGGLANWDSDVQLRNVTLSANLATNTGGAIFNDWSVPWVTNSTIVGNAANASSGGGGIYNINESHVQVRNSILWNNSNGQMVAVNNSGPALYYSISQGGCPAGVSCPDVIINADPKLGTFGRYGGFTPLLPLLIGSPAIDAAEDIYCPAADQRGIARPLFAHCDMGAYEWKLSLYLPFISR